MFFKSRINLFSSKKNRGFTLIETLVGMLVIVAVSVAAWISVTALRASDEVNQNEILAVNLLQKSQEEVRRVAQNPANYTILGTPVICDFTGGAPCNFDDITASFPGFQRTLTVTDEVGTASFKRVVVNVTWPELGAPRNLSSVLLLARPPDPLPGSLIGRATDAVTGAFIDVAQISLGPPNAGLPVTYSAVSSAAPLARLDGQIVNYDFSGGGPFLIEPGTWTLTASSSGYEDFGPVNVPTIVSNAEIVFNFTMTPKPADGVVEVTFRDVVSGNNLFVNNYPRVKIFDDGVQLGGALHTKTVFAYTIEFKDTTPKEFTVATEDLYKMGFVGACTGGKFDRRGWSSSAFKKGVDIGQCGQPWAGNSGQDRLEVKSGQTTSEIALVTPIPKARIYGFVYDNLGAIIANAEIYLRLPDGNSYYLKDGPVATTNAAGYYEINNAPAVQELFDRSLTNQLIIFAKSPSGKKYLRCCDVVEGVEAFSSRSDPDQRVGVLTMGSSVSKDMIISSVPDKEECGNATGGIYNDPLSGLTGPIGAASVNIGGAAEPTSGLGQYLHECTVASTGYRVVAGVPPTSVSKAGYYTFESTGNAYYKGIPVVVKPNAMNSVGDIKLWPIGFGTLEIVVTEKNSGLPIPNAHIELYRSYDSSGVSSGDTDAGGKFVVSPMEESWPPDAVLSDTSRYYSTNLRPFHFWLSYPPDPIGVPSVRIDNVEVKKDQTTVINVTLDIKGTF